MRRSIHTTMAPPAPSLTRIGCRCSSPTEPTGRPFTGQLPDAKIYAELASEEKAPLLPGIIAGILSEPQLKADPIHPNAAGYRRLASEVTAQLRHNGLLGQP